MPASADEVATPRRSVRTLSVAAPAYNEADVIEGLIEGWVAHLRTQPGLTAFEIVICDDGSTDATGAILARLAARHPEVRVVSHRPNRGGGVAMARAIGATRHAWVLLLDSDGQFPIACFERLAAEVERSGARAVLGAREHKQDTAFARFGSAASSFVANLVYGTRYRDFNSTCKLCEGPLLRSLRLEARGLNYSTDTLAKLLEAGIVPAEVLVPHLPREKGKSTRTAIGSTLDRLGFVLYLAMRRALLARGVIVAPEPG